LQTHNIPAQKKLTAQTVKKELAFLL